MNADRCRRQGRYLLIHCVVGWAVLTGSGIAAERHWMDWVGTPWIDPLLVRPPQLDTELVLPGDTWSQVCDPAGPDLRRALRLQDAVDIALCVHPQLRYAAAGIEKSAAQVGEARAAYLPNLQLGHSQTTEHIHNARLSGARRDLERMRDADFASLTWRLLDFGTRDAQRRAANALLESALANRDAVVQRTLARVISAYFEARISSAALLARQEYEALARKTWQTSQQREALGAASHSDSLQALIAFSRAELDRHRALRAQQRAEVALVQAMGLPDASVPAQGMRLAQDLSEPHVALGRDLSDWLAVTEAEHPALVAVRAQLQQVREQLVAVRAEGFPTLDFSHGLYRNGRPNQSVFSEPSEQTVSSVTLKVPLFEGFSRTYKVRGAEAQLAQKEAEVLEIQNRVLGEVRDAHADAESAAHSLLVSRKLLDTSLEALQLVQKQYDRGVVDILAVLGVQRALAEAQQERIRCLSDWHSARLRLLAQTGGLGRGGVTQEALLLPGK